MRRRSTVSFGLLINHEEKAARKAQEEKLQEWRYNKRTAEMRAQSKRDQEKEAKKSRPERGKWKKPLSKEETTSTRTEEKRNKGLERWVENFKAKIHERITNPRPSPVLEEDQDAKDIEPELLIVYVRAESMDDQLGPEADHEKDLTTAYASGDILGSLSSAKLVQPFACKEYDPVELLRHEEGLQHFIFEPGIRASAHKNSRNTLAEQNHIGSFILEGPDLSYS
ncbi:hypothetical protein Bca52824_074913 [Brassica carinata]|uniref:Uncharacterized protein n=1 Tax=Brassica carinata TaxID=52824 RepID=A0A8X7PNI9_BRACI|nr:hypothetical protein Bca52824_074913 [Brassica carinata]